MEKTTLTNSQSRALKGFIHAKPGEGRFSNEYIQSVATIRIEPERQVLRHSSVLAFLGFTARKNSRQTDTRSEPKELDRCWT